MKSKHLWFSLCMLCLLLALVACGGKGNTTDTTPETDPASLTEAPTQAVTEAVTTASPEVPTAEPASEAVTEPTTEPETESTTMDYFEASYIPRVEPDEKKYPDMAIAGDGYDVYMQTRGVDWGYRYGCTYLYNEDGSVDAYFACVGSISGEWDWISYRHSPDGGQTWGPEKIVLTPTQNSMDHFSNCDPGVVYFNGYYYLGYTSTLNGAGFCNNLYVARSRHADGPFEKWNGNGWGGPTCQPIVYFDENWESWGIGEPSFVELNGTLYMYYTSTSPSGGYTMVATADARDENWPAHLTFHGVAVKKNSDSLDVKYVEEWGKFVAVATSDRMGGSSWLSVYESNDGIHLTLVDAVREGTYTHLHNAGLSSRPNGHIRLSEDAEKLRVIYAYGEGWGTWNTRIQPITLALSNGNDINAERAKPNVADPGNRAEPVPPSEQTPALVRPVMDVYQYPVSKGDFNIVVNGYYGETFTCRSIRRGDQNLSFTDYDESVITIKNNKATIVGVGETTVTVRYGDLACLIYVKITETDELGAAGDAVGFEPVRETYTIAYHERSLFRPQIRGQIKWANGTFTELYVQASDEVVTYEGYDASIISVNAMGIITAKAIGETDVVVTCRGMSCTVHVVVTADETKGYFSHEAPEVVDYTNLDFTEPKTQELLGSTNNCTVEFAGEGIKLTVTNTSPIDPIFTISYANAPDPIHTADYGKLEIVYKVPTSVAAAGKRFQVFIGAGDVTSPSASYQVMKDLVVDGEYHTLVFDLASLSYWKGDINFLRFDFFDACSPGDVMYIQSIKLVK